MSLGGVNLIAVVVAVIASMALGFVWYMVLGKRWMAALGRTEAAITQGGMGSSPTPFIWSAAMQFISAYSLALLLPRVMGAVTLQNGLILGFHLWLGFSITTMLTNHRYQQSSWRLTFIDGGYMLGVLMLQGIVIGLFG
jgi:hypothetical protein